MQVEDIRFCQKHFSGYPYLCLKSWEHSKIVNDSNKSTVEGTAILKTLRADIEITMTLRHK